MTELIVISGASTGIGRATALKLASEGKAVLAGVRNEKAADDLLTASEGQLKPVFLDIAKPDSIEKFIADHEENISSNGLHGLVNNAGLLQTAPLEHMPMSTWRHMFDVNVFGHVELTQKLLPFIRDAKGRVVFTSSASTRVSLPLGAAYCGAKNAIEGVGDSLRRELAPFGVSVSIVEPGAIETPMLHETKNEYDKVAESITGGGAEVYRHVANRLSETMTKFASQSTPPEKVAEAISHALFSPKPKARYFVGTDARTLCSLAAVTTDRTMDRILKKMFGL